MQLTINKYINSHVQANRLMQILHWGCDQNLAAKEKRRIPSKSTKARARKITDDDDEDEEMDGVAGHGEFYCLF